MAKVVDFEQAEKNARKRDLDFEKLQYALDHGGISEEQLNLAMEQLSRAVGKDLYIGTKRSPQSKVRFVQLIQENLLYLRTNKYLTTAEKNFLMDISPNVELLSNCIVDDISKKSPMPLTQKDIADILGKKKQNVNPIIKGLIDKGIFARSESGLDENNVRAYSLFVNPNIMFSGDKEHINSTLKAMFKKVPKELKNIPIDLFKDS